MKIRTGFVSNSSSSSFVLFGIHTNFETIKNELKPEFQEEFQKASDDYEEYDFFGKHDLSMYSGGDEGDVLGMPCDDWNQDKTLRQLQAEATEKLQKILTKVDPDDVQMIYDSTYDG